MYSFNTLFKPLLSTSRQQTIVLWNKDPEQQSVALWELQLQKLPETCSTSLRFSQVSKCNFKLLLYWISASAVLEVYIRRVQGREARQPANCANPNCSYKTVSELKMQCMLSWTHINLPESESHVLQLLWTGECSCTGPGLGLKYLHSIPLPNGFVSMHYTENPITASHHTV